MRREMFSWELNNGRKVKRQYSIDLYQIASMEADWDENNKWWNVNLIFNSGSKTMVWMSVINFDSFRSVYRTTHII
jgi:hypothetical protein